MNIYLVERLRNCQVHKQHIFEIYTFVYHSYFVLSYRVLTVTVKTLYKQY